MSLLTRWVIRSSTVAVFVVLLKYFEELEFLVLPSLLQFVVGFVLPVHDVFAHLASIQRPYWHDACCQSQHQSHFKRREDALILTLPYLQPFTTNGGPWLQKTKLYLPVYKWLHMAKSG